MDKDKTLYNNITKRVRTVCKICGEMYGEERYAFSYERKAGTSNEIQELVNYHANTVIPLSMDTQKKISAHMLKDHPEINDVPDVEIYVRISCFADTVKEETKYVKTDILGNVSIVNKGIQ